MRVERRAASGFTGATNDDQLSYVPFNERVDREDAATIAVAVRGQSGIPIRA